MWVPPHLDVFGSIRRREGAQGPRLDLGDVDLNQMEAEDLKDRCHR